MVIFKCKMCGGDLDIIENVSLCADDFCGTQQILPFSFLNIKSTAFPEW